MYIRTDEEDAVREGVERRHLNVIDGLATASADVFPISDTLSEF
jgi:hypothetical protein